MVLTLLLVLSRAPLITIDIPRRLPCWRKEGCDARLTISWASAAASQKPMEEQRDGLDIVVKIYYPSFCH